MKVIKKQPNTLDCVICGINNEFGLKAPFYETETNEVVTLFEFKEHHQSYPGRTHGGIISIHYINKDQEEFMRDYKRWYDIIKKAKFLNTYWRNNRILNKSEYFELW